VFYATRGRIAGLNFRKKLAPQEIKHIIWSL